MTGVAVRVRRRGLGAQPSVLLVTGDVIHTSGAPRRDVLQNWAQKQRGHVASFLGCVSEIGVEHGGATRPRLLGHREGDQLGDRR